MVGTTVYIMFELYYLSKVLLDKNNKSILEHKRKWHCFLSNKFLI